MNIKRMFGAIISAMRGSAHADDDPLQRELVRVADDARDSKQYLVAAKLYDQSLRAGAPTVDILLQCGHMHKEARKLSDA